MFKHLLILSLIALSLSLNEDCTVNGMSGTCIYTSKCSEFSGTYYSGYCPGANDIKCCVSPKCDSGKGVCQSRYSCTRTLKSGLCPGGNDFMCCTSGGDPVVPPKYTENGKKIVEAAKSMEGYPFSLVAGDENGPTYGYEEDIYPYCNDTKVKGFNASGLTLYAVAQVCGIILDHNIQSQYDYAYNHGLLLPLKQVKPGDIVFFGYNDNKIYDVGVYSGNNKMWGTSGHSKNCKGAPVKEKNIRYDIMDKVARFC